MAYPPRPCATVWVRNLKQHGTRSFESFNNLLDPPFLPPVCHQNNPDLVKLLPMVVVAAEPDGVIMSKAQECHPRAHLSSKLDGPSSPAQATHMRLPTLHTNWRRRLPHPCGQRSIKTSHQRPPRFPSMEGLTGCPCLENVARTLVIRRIPLHRYRTILLFRRTDHPQSDHLETHSPTLLAWVAHAARRIRKNVSNFLHSIPYPHRLRVIQDRLSYLYPPSLPGLPPLSPMTPELFFRDYEQVMVLVLNPFQKHILIIRGAHPLCHQRLSKLVT